MQQSQSTPKNWPEINHPACASCGQQMWLARRSPDGPQREKRTFDCPVCDISETAVVESK